MFAGARWTLAPARVVLLLASLSTLPLLAPPAFAQSLPGDPDPTLLPVATTLQVPLTAAYNALNVPSIAAGGWYLDPTTNVKIYKLTSATFPASSPNWGHDYAEGGNEVSLPYNGNTRAVLVRQNGSGTWWLVDFTPGVGVSNPRQLTGNLDPIMDLAFTFSNNPATPYYAYVSRGSTIYRFDIQTMTEAPGDGWPVTGETSAVWLHQSENDGMFVWMRGASGDTMVAYEPATGTKKTYTNANMNEPRIDRAGRYVGLSMSGNAITVWDWNTNGVVWSAGGTIPFAHQASLKRRWYGVNWNITFPAQFTRFLPDVPNSAANIGGPANGHTIHGNGNWIQNPVDLKDQWAVFLHYGSLVPNPTWNWLSPGGMILITENGQRRLLGHPYNTTSNYTFYSFAKFSPDGKYVLFTSNMNDAGRSDLFLAELPEAPSTPDPTPPTVSITAPASGATASGTITVSANASDEVGVVGVQFKLDGTNLGAEDTSAPYSISWNTTLASNGSHTLTAVARDAAGNTGTSSAVTVTVSNPDTTPPTVSLASPLPGATVSNTITLVAAASDNVAVAGVQFRLDGTNLGPELVLSPYLFSWPTTTVPNGPHTLTAVARDAAGNVTTSAAVTVTVSNDTTSPLLSAVTASAITASGAIITWTTNEASGSQVEYGPTTAYGSMTTLITTLVTAHSQTLNGLAAGALYHYRVRSRDVAGNLAVSGDFTLTTLAPPPADLVVYRPPTPITVDGVLNEWDGVTAVPFSGLSNGATGYLAWDSTNLYVAFKVTDAQLGALQTTRDSGSLWQDDSVEVYIDTLSDRASAMQPDDYQFLVNLNNALGDLRGTGGGKDPAWNATWLSTVTRQGTLNSHGDTDSGYTVEMAIPWGQLGVTPATGMYLGLDLAVNDSDPASATTFDYFDWARIAPASFAQPYLWKRVQLVDTVAAPPDTTAPSVAMTAPAAGATVSGTIAIAGTAADNVALSRVEVLVDSGAPQPASGTTSWTLTLDTRTLSNGTHTVVARAVDTAGNAGTASVSVTVSNDITPPTLSMTAPLGGSTVLGIITVAADASDNVGIVGVQFRLDGANLGPEDTTNTHSVSWDTTTAANGAHTLTAVARDAAGNINTSAAVSVMVNNPDITPPTVSITSPLNAAIVAQTITVLAVASDNVAVAGVQLKLDGANFGAEQTASPYSIPWNTTTAANGPHTLTAVARDASGNTAISGGVTVTVSNDITPPLIAGVSASNLSPFVATVSWTTGEASDTQIEYGLTTTYGSLAPLNTSLVTTHSQTLTGLAAGALYHYRVRSRDAAGNLAVSGDFTLTTPPPPPADIVVYRPPMPITVDGGRDEWSGATAVQFSGLSNDVTAYLSWDPTNLYVAFRATDTQLSALQTARDAATLWEDDSVEVYIDTLSDRASAMQPDDYQFLVNLNNVQVDLRGTGSGKDTTWNGTWTSAVSRQGTLNSHADTDSGYVVEMAIPWAQLGVTPATGMYLGLELALNDSDPASATTFDYFDWARIAPASFAQPRLWKWIQLVDTVPPPDTTPPSVAIASPASDLTVFGTITIAGTAADTVELSRVEVLVDSGAPQLASGTTNWTLTLNTLTLSNGPHTIVARALDATGNAGTAPVSVTVFNDTTPPLAAITSPLNGATVSGAITVGADASDNVGIVGIQFKLDGANLGAEVTVAPYGISWDTTRVPGVHTLTAVARDAAGNVTTSAVVSVTVADATPPAVFVTAPLSGATVAATMAVSTTATDNVGVVGVQFKLDGMNLGVEDTVAPYAVFWDTKTVVNGSHTLTAIARDAAGNIATSAAITVTVDNPDLIPPAVSITSPLTEATVSETITLSVVASDNIALAGVQWKLDGANLGAELTAPPYSFSWSTRAAANGTHTLTAVARDTSGNTATSSAVTVIVGNDVTPPLISWVSASNISSSAAIITWTTNEASDSQVEYGPTTAYGSVAPLDPSLVTTHSQTLSGLAASTLYHYRVKSRDAAGNLATSGDFTFTTLAPPPTDLAVYRTLTPVTVDGVLSEWGGAGTARFSGLSNGATVFLLWDATYLYLAFQVTDTQLGAIQSARDALALYEDDTVEVYLDTRADRTTTMQPDDYQFLVNLNNAQGDLRGTGGGKDPAWNATWLSAATRQGTLNSHGDTDSGYIVEMAIPWAQIGVTPSSGKYLGIDLTVDDKDATTFDYFDWARIAPGSYAQPNLWKRVQLADTPPDTTPPSVAITSPASGATISGTISIAGTAADNVELSHVEVLVDGGAPQPASGTTAWTLSLNTLALSNGPHTIVARVVDSAGNMGTASVSVTVSNDITRPSVAITSPLSGATVLGTITVAADASDNIGIVGIQFKLDGANLGAEDTTNAYSITWNTTTAPNGSHTLTAVARDGAGNVSTSTVITVIVNNDTTPPVLSAVTASTLTSSGTTITWTTNEASDSQVEYGPTTAYGSVTALDPSLVTAHSQTLSGLPAGTLVYHYRVKSRDAAGNLATSGDMTFTTLP